MLAEQTTTIRPIRSSVAGLLLAALALAAHAGGEPEAELTACTEPRPQICTMQYDPVCGRVEEQGQARWESFASDCSACADPRVSGHRPGECPAPGSG